MEPEPRRPWPIATVVALALLAGTALSAKRLWSGPAPDQPLRLGAAEAASKLRVTAKPGDPKLVNAHVTAVVRKRDGWLTELWPNRTRLPTQPQLGTTTDIDALWQLYPCVKIGKDTHPVLATLVTGQRDVIVTEGTVQVPPIEVHARTEFRLAPAAAELQLSTTFTVKAGPAKSVAFGDVVRWGNVQYVVEGQARALSQFKGVAGWIGRSGAGGDLLLRAPRPFALEFKEKDPGFAGPIEALYWSGVPSGPVTVTRALAFETLPRKPPVAPAAHGTLELGVDDEHGRPLAAKVKLERTDRATPTFDRDGDSTGADRFLWTGNGQVQRELPAGTYRLIVSAGIERELVQRTVTIKPGRTVQVAARLPRVLQTPGWVGADLHLHQAPSVDADISLADRVLSIAAEGVEFAVATDHYVVTDLAPTVRWLTERGVLKVPVSTMPGIEVSTVGRRFGHFNVFPMATDDGLLAEDTTPDELFPVARRKSPGGVLQVNHPRWAANIGYFTYYDLDPATGQARRAGYNPNFDTLEVYNGLDAHDLPLVERLFSEWLRLLGNGYRYAATGSSDSHKLAFLDPGLPRTMIRWGAASDDAADAAAPASALIDAIKAGRSIVTSGPWIDATIAGHGPGDTVHAREGKLRLLIRVQAAGFVDVREVTVHEGGSGRVIFRQRLVPSRHVDRLIADVPLNVTSPTFVVVAARGERPLPNAAQPVRPFAFTNPIWIVP